ncbi:GntR family transcriptional regulator [Paenibacillus pasadenensis]|uniref:GntR family transcriptional regulator n=1 Tax=Paenibacillus pasadenensis TaxID=217090 RepID=UPI0020410D00|nr:GntR family transcriptional regulator [Paenibacillus pasadenensis]MCM3749459.1 GntR family transcriptional regulator [Paenibacillus pasadenensis]
MIVTLDYESEVPLYSQLYDEIVRGIAEGSMKPGESLPSVRSLAGDLSINLHTVNKTYQLLKQEGHVLIHRQKGAVVQPPGSAKATPEYMERMERQLRSLAAESICRQLDEAQFLESCRSIYREVKGGSSK